MVCGGTAACFAAIVKHIPIYQREAIHLTSCPQKQLGRHLKKMLKMDIEERKKIIGMETDRADILPGGLMILMTFLRYFKIPDFTISANGLRLGLIKYFFEKNIRY